MTAFIISIYMQVDRFKVEVKPLKYDQTCNVEKIKKKDYDFIPFYKYKCTYIHYIRDLGPYLFFSL